MLSFNFLFLSSTEFQGSIENLLYFYDRGNGINFEPAKVCWSLVVSIYDIIYKFHVNLYLIMFDLITKVENFQPKYIYNVYIYIFFF